MISIFLGPKQYVQKEGALEEAGKALAAFGRRPLILADSVVSAIIRTTLEKQLPAAGLSPSFALFGGECSQSEILRLMDIVKKEKLDLIVGTGGGRALDTSRMVADRLKFPLVTIPTSSATCSSASAAAVLYEKGIRLETINGKGAELCLVDSGIISRAPAKLLAAGMGDALSKYYEGKPVYEKGTNHDIPTQAAMNLSIQLRQAILENGIQAMKDVGAKKNSPAVEKMIETSLLLTGVISGLGGSKFRIAVAHALLYGLTVLPQLHDNLHGETVSWGIVVQLCLEKNEKELDILLPFFKKLGLPLTLKDLKLENVEDPLFWEGLKRTCVPGSSVHNLPFPVDEKKLFDAIIDADKRARALKI
jgi:glycerol dehydrogenase